MALLAPERPSQHQVKENGMSLAQAPAEVQLAVDLIALLESNGLEPELVLKALQLVQRDFQQKLNDAQTPAR